MLMSIDIKTNTNVYVFIFGKSIQYHKENVGMFLLLSSHLKFFYFDSEQKTTVAYYFGSNMGVHL